MTTVIILALLWGLSPFLHGQPTLPMVHWYPTLSVQSGTKTEGIYVFITGLSSPATTVTVRSEVKGVPTVTSGLLDPDTAFLATPVGNVGTYRLIRLEIINGSHAWILDRPRPGHGYALMLPRGKR